MRKKKSLQNIIVPMLGFLMVGAALAMIIYWETGGRETWLYEDVIVLNQDVERGVAITPDMLNVLSVESSKKVEGAIQDPSRIVGQEARHFVPSNLQLRDEFFEDPILVTDENTYVAKIPTDWIYSVPSSLRRKDIIIIKGYHDITKEQEASPAAEESLYKVNTPGLIKELQYEKPLVKTVVAYVKDASNREVVDIGDEDRLVGSSQVREIEILTSIHEFKKLEAAINQGNKLVIMYSEQDTLAVPELPEKEDKNENSDTK